MDQNRDNKRISRENSTSWKSDNKNDSNKKTPKGSSRKDVRCFNCGGRGQESKYCNSKGLNRKYFACNKFGHVENECTEKKSGKSNDFKKSADVNLLMVNMNSKFHKKIRDR